MCAFYEKLYDTNFCLTKGSRSVKPPANGRTIESPKQGSDEENRRVYWKVRCLRKGCVSPGEKHRPDLVEGGVRGGVAATERKRTDIATGQEVKGVAIPPPARRGQHSSSQCQPH